MADTILTALSRTDPEWFADVAHLGFARPEDFRAWLAAGWSRDLSPVAKAELDRERLLPEFAD